MCPDDGPIKPKHVGQLLLNNLYLINYCAFVGVNCIGQILQCKGKALHP